MTCNFGALISRTGCWGPVYYTYNEEPPRNSIGNYEGPYVSAEGSPQLLQARDVSQFVISKVLINARVKAYDVWS